MMPPPDRYRLIELVNLFEGRKYLPFVLPPLCLLLLPDLLFHLRYALIPVLPLNAEKGIVIVGELFLLMYWAVRFRSFRSVIGFTCNDGQIEVAWGSPKTNLFIDPKDIKKIATAGDFLVRVHRKKRYPFWIEISKEQREPLLIAMRAESDSETGVAPLPWFYSISVRREVAASIGIAIVLAVVFNSVLAMFIPGAFFGTTSAQWTSVGMLFIIDGLLNLAGYGFAADWTANNRWLLAVIVCIEFALGFVQCYLGYNFNL